MSSCFCCLRALLQVLVVLSIRLVLLVLLPLGLLLLVPLVLLLLLGLALLARRRGAAWSCCPFSFCACCCGGGAGFACFLPWSLAGLAFSSCVALFFCVLLVLLSVGRSGGAHDTEQDGRTDDCDSFHERVLPSSA